VKNWTKYAVLNFSMILGFFVSLFLLPPATYFWPVFFAFVAFLGFSNYGLFRRLKAPKPVSNRAENLAWAVIVLLLLLFDLLLSRLPS
jgi:hypothetical protein